MIGIYKITNKINNKCYIGKSTNIRKRFLYHKYNYKTKKEQNKILYKAFQKYGIDNFTFEIQEIIQNKIELNIREQYWIKYFNSKSEGYNMTDGGDGGAVPNLRDKIGKLSVNDVIYIRKRYLECKYPMSYIYEVEFQNQITRRGFESIWYGKLSKEIMPEAYSESTKIKQQKLNRAYAGVLKRKISLEEKLKLRRLHNEGMPYTVLWNHYSNIYSLGGFRDMIKNISLDERVNLNGKELEELSF